MKRKQKTRSQKTAGIRKQVAEAFYPKDWLSDKDLAGANLAVQGAWMRYLCYMWLDDTDRVSGPIETHARILGCSTEECNAIVTSIKGCKVGVVKYKNRGSKDVIVTVISRRLERRLKAKQNLRLRVMKHRAKAGCNGNVTSKKHASSSSPSSSGVNRGECNTPQSGVVTPVYAESPAEKTTLTSLVTQFKGKANWIGPDRILYERFREALKFFSDGDLSEGIERMVRPGMKHFVFFEQMQKRRAGQPRRPRRPTEGELARQKAEDERKMEQAYREEVTRWQERKAKGERVPVEIGKILEKELAGGTS